MKKKLALVVVLVMLVSILVPTLTVYGQTSPVNSVNYGEKAYEHMIYLSTEIGTREVATSKEVMARDYINQIFIDLGYSPEIQEFVHTRTRNEVITEYPSSNVIAVKPGLSSKQIIVGAHYDTKTNPGQESESLGADDNASGVGVMLEIAERLKDISTIYTIKFIAFGAEEVGLGGSKYYASQMSKDEIENTIAMINLDSITAGDMAYIYGGFGKAGWVRDQALSIANVLNLGIETNPGLNADYPKGTTGPWSDHAPFEELGIPYAYFEATNWEIGELDGYDQSEEYGSIFHTSMDTLDFLEAAFPGRIQERLKSFTTVLYHLLITITPPFDIELLDAIEELEAEPELELNGSQYTVVSGDSIWKIAKKHNTTVQVIIELNKIKNPNLIHPGQILLISVE